MNKINITKPELSISVIKSQIIEVGFKNRLWRNLSNMQR